MTSPQGPGRLAVGFDLGDTLCEYAGVPLNWEREYPAALAAVAEACEHQLTAERLAAGVRLLSRYNTRNTPRENEHTAEHIFGELSTAWAMPRECLARSVAAFFGHFRQRLRAFSDSAGVLNGLYRVGVPAGVLTDVPYGMPRSLVLADLAQATLPISDARIVTSTEVGYRKPHSLGFIALAQALGVGCEQLVYVGNERKDVDGANAVGCRSVLLWRSTQPPPAWGQAYTIHSLDQLFALLKLPEP